MRLLLVRPNDGLSRLASELEAAGHKVIQLALSKVLPLEVKLLKPLTAYSWVFITSRQGLKHFLAYLQQQNLACPETLKLAVVGQATKAYAQQQGFKVDFCPKKGEGAEQAAAEFLAYHAQNTSSAESQTLLWPCSILAEPTLQTHLEDNGWQVERWPLYETRLQSSLNPEQAALVQAHYDAVLFTSASSVKAWFACVPEEQRFDIPVWLSLGASTTACITALAPTQKVLQAASPLASDVLALLASF
jgi:uroporphyrinogen-III synthase